MADGTETTKTKHVRSLGVLAFAAALVIVRLALPVGVGLFLGALLAFTLQPIYERLRSRGLGAGVAAFSCTLAATALVVAAVAATVSLFITRGVALVGALPMLLGPGGPVRAFVDATIAKLSPHHFDPAVVSAKLEEEGMALGARAAGTAAGFAGASFGAVITIFFMALATYFVLRHWEALVQYAEEMLPFERRHTHALLDQFRRAGGQVLRGTVVTGIVQAFAAGLGYFIVGIPEPVFFGLLTGVASLVPAVGTLLVWVPVGVYLIATGHVVTGVVSLVISAVFVGIIPDYVVRPRLVGKDQGVPTVLTFVSLIGGAHVFGIVGLVLGPVLVTLSVAVLRTYHAQLVAR